MIIGLLQAFVAAVGFALFGLPYAILAGLAALVFSILPIIGPYIVYIPVSIVLIAQGDVSTGIGLLIYIAVYMDKKNRCIHCNSVCKTQIIENQPISGYQTLSVPNQTQNQKSIIITQSAGEKPKFCYNCGSELEQGENSKFCRLCGNTIA